LLEVEHRDARARGALELYVRRVVREIGSLTAVLGGLDMLAFTAGVGEHSACCAHGSAKRSPGSASTIDDTANAEHGPVISRKRSGVLVAVEPTNEEWIAARHALRCVGEAAAEMHRSRP
jgi:acetate kinase